MSERDAAYESGFLRYVEMLAEHLTHRPPDGALTRLMLERQSIGKRDYGDWAFLNDDRNLPHEAREEQADALFYCMADAEKHSDQPGDECYHLLTEAAAHFTAGDLLLRRVEALRRKP